MRGLAISWTVRMAVVGVGAACLASDGSLEEAVECFAVAVEGVARPILRHCVQTASHSYDQRVSATLHLADTSAR